MTGFAIRARKNSNTKRRSWSIAGCGLTLLLGMSAAIAEDEADLPTPTPNAIPDIRDDNLRVKLQERNWFIVPIPFSNPTIDTGLALAGAYFHPQTDAQKEVQPPSMTGAGVFYSSNDSAAFGISHRAYWKEDTWRFSGVLGYIDLNLELPSSVPGEQTIDWNVEGKVVAAIVSRKIRENWYGGVLVRYLELQQGFGIGPPSAEFNTVDDAKSSGVGLRLERDSRDKPINSYSGSIFELTGLSNSDTFDSDDSYSSYTARFRSYHRIAKPVVLAWDLQGCYRSGRPPLWDACRVDLRGFSATDYLGGSSISGQVEARWQFHDKWGAVAFAGGGTYSNAFNDIRENDLIPSFGIGLRYRVLASQRINMRLDYGRSRGSDAVYLAVGEAF